MLILVTGGSGSGKSAFAEQKAVSLAAGGELVYLATMQVYGEEGKKKVERHRQLRRGKGFETIERPVRVDRAEPGEDATVLLECMSNLMANEMFSPDPPEEKEGGWEEAWRRILRQIEVLYSKCRHLVIVTGEVFSGELPPWQEGRGGLGSGVRNSSVAEKRRRTGKNQADLQTKL